MTPWDFTNAINNKTEVEWNDITEKEYIPWMINNVLSYNPQTLIFANEINKYAGLPKKLQFDFYYTGVPKGKRFNKIESKSKPEEDVILLKEVYNINAKQAEEYLSLLTKEQLESIKLKRIKGGKS